MNKCNKQKEQNGQNKKNKRDRRNWRKEENKGDLLSRGHIIQLINKSVILFFIVCAALVFVIASFIPIRGYANLIEINGSNSRTSTMNVFSQNNAEGKVINAVGEETEKRTKIMQRTKTKTVSVEPYIASINIPQTPMAMIDRSKIHVALLKKHSINLSQLQFPSSSSFTYGKVKKHHLLKQKQLNLSSFLSTNSFFLIGDDQASIRWAKVNASYLIKGRAIGFLTNVKSSDRLKAIEQKTGLTLFVVNCNGLEDIVDTHHYPFFFKNGWVVQ